MSKITTSFIQRGALCLLILGGASCAGLSPREQGQARQLREAGISDTEMGTKKGWVSGCLNIIPGVGNFYLASGKDSGSQVIYGILNIIPGWLVWPITCAWSVPQAAVDAGNINRRQTIVYFFETEDGKKEFEQRKADTLKAESPNLPAPATP